MHRRLISIAAIAAAYWLFARFGLLLAVPPGYASAVWPPSGIALGAMLVWGNRLLPGIWLGSFLANAVTAFDPSAPLVSLLAPAASAWAPRAKPDWPHTPSAAGWVIPAPAGRPGGAVAPGLGRPAGQLRQRHLQRQPAVLAGQLSWEDFATHWATWWVGDSIGGLIFTPLMLIFFGAPHASWRMRRKTVALPLLASFATATALFAYARQSEEQHQLREFTQATELMFNNAEAGIVRYNSAVWSLRSLFDASNKVEREEFRRFTDPILSREPGLQALSWNVRLPASERRAFEEAQRAEGVADFTVREQDAEGRLSPARARDEYTVVTYIEILATNRSALGYDVASEPTRRAALEQARDSGEMVATAPIELVQDSGVLARSSPDEEKKPRQQPGVLLFLPVYNPKAEVTDTEQRRAHLEGFVVGVLRLGDMLDSILPPTSPQRLLLPLRLTDADQNVAGSLQVDGAFDGKAKLYRHRILSIGGRHWRLEMSGKAADFGQNWAAWYVLAGGLLFTGLLGGVLLLLTSRTLRVESLVRMRTDELAGNNDRLRQEIVERAKTEAALRESEARFRSMADAAPVMIWVADADAQCSYANKSLLEFTGLTLAQAVGQGWAESIHPDDLARCLATYEAAFGAREQFSQSFRLRRRDGEYRWVLDSGVPRFDANGDFAGYIGSGIDIGDLKQAQEDMLAAKEAAEQASRVKSQFLANMSHEIRTPMNAILGFSSLGQELAEPSEGHEYFGYIHTAAENLLVVINDILDFSKVEAGELRIDSALFNLRELVDRATALVMPKPPRKGWR
ncbi:CHASE domain-containing protein [Methylogaea oryzae]|uniref:CHASE domain-containing protein n=1 Tax=Methylogaea oryzae TaxID=1295382 RepID=UPI0006D21D66|nr:CHASE domain-containing protein [Methylogaea oryzae]